MRRLFPAIALVVCCLLIPLSPAASAPDSLQVVDTSVDSEFPARLVFSIDAESANPITDIRLMYQMDRMNYASVTSEAWPQFEPSTTVDTSWTWDMRRSSLPPGASMSYWWKVSDSTGAVLETTPEKVVFSDDRYDWSVLESESVNIHWYEGDAGFAQGLADVCEEAVDTLALDVGTRVERQIDVYIYASSTDLRQSMVYPQEWTGGAAFTEYGIVAIGIGPSNLDWGTRALRHELTHLVVHAATFSPFGQLPTWMDEGLAMYNEGETDESFEALLLSAAGQDMLISLRTLSGPFSSDSQKAYLSYAESESVVRYLLDEYGSAAMHDALIYFKDGETDGDALLMSFGSGLDDIEIGWHASLQEQLAHE